MSELIALMNQFEHYFETVSRQIIVNGIILFLHIFQIINAGIYVGIVGKNNLYVYVYCIVLLIQHGCYFIMHLGYIIVNCIILKKSENSNYKTPNYALWRAWTLINYMFNFASAIFAIAGFTDISGKIDLNALLLLPLIVQIIYGFSIITLLAIALILFGILQLFDFCVTITNIIPQKSDAEKPEDEVSIE